MTGLEKIIAQIQSESEQECDAIMQQAKLEARVIVEDKKAKANEDAKKLIEDAEAEAERLFNAAKVSSEALTRTKYLEVRNAVVNDIIAAAYEDILNYSDEKYFNLLVTLLQKYIEPGQCSMILSKRDLERLPKDFEDEVNSLVYETSAVAVSKTPGKLDSGFVLEYADFSINCSIKNLFEENMDAIKDALCTLLFE